MVPGTLRLLLFCCCCYSLVGLAFLFQLDKKAARCTIKGIKTLPLPFYVKVKRGCNSRLCGVATAARLGRGWGAFSGLPVSAGVRNAAERTQAHTADSAVSRWLTSVLCICKHFSVRWDTKCPTLPISNFLAPASACQDKVSGGEKLSLSRSLDILSSLLPC